MQARPLMIQGTASGAGKTTVALALCRIFRLDGFITAPFKSQNMTGNTVTLPRGGEIAVSQLLQAYAAETEPTTEINPVILMPSRDGKSVELIINGRRQEKKYAENYENIKDSVIIPEIQKSYDSLYLRNEIIVIEGAGSPVELNLNKNDIVNMGIAKRVNAPVILVADIDRGGVFASIFGTLMLMDDKDRQRVKAIVINRFMGEPAGFEEGKNIIETITNLPVAGIIPHIDFDLPEEDECLPRRRGEECSFLADDLVGAKPETEFVMSQIDEIADIIRHSLDMALIYRIIGL